MTGLGAKTSSILPPPKFIFFVLTQSFLNLFSKNQKPWVYIVIIGQYFLIFWKNIKKWLSYDKNMGFWGLNLRTFLPLNRSNFFFFQKSFLICILLSNTLLLTYWKPKSENVIFSTLLVAEKVKALYEFWREKKKSLKFLFLSCHRILFTTGDLKILNFFKKGPIVTPLRY